MEKARKAGKWIKWRPNSDTLEAIISSLVVLCLSSLMQYFQKNSLSHVIVSVVLRDILMILGSFTFVLIVVTVIHNQDMSTIGITTKNIKKSIVFNILFAIALLLMLLKNGKPQIQFDYGVACACVYIFVAGIFEMVYIYSYIRTRFEQAFGIIPSIIITSAIYSFHHIGFQPEFKKLFFVGIMYTSVIYITNNVFMVFPFFWGVGSLWDVLINSTAGLSIRNTASLCVAIFVFICMTLVSVYFIQRQLFLNRIVYFEKRPNPYDVKI